ncbi:MAG: ABC transporter substrate-binding protein [Flavobacteriaceae bacterium]
MKKVVFRRAIKFAAIAIGGMLAASSASAEDVKGVTPDKLILGHMSSMSGPLAQYGISLDAGTKAYIAKINDAGGVHGKKVELISEDHAYQTAQALAIWRRMQGGDGVFGLLNVNGGHIVAAFLESAKQAKTIIWAPYGGDTAWYSPPQTGLFGLYSLYEPQAEALASWAAKDGHKKVVQINIDAASFMRGKAAFEAAFKAAVPGASITSIDTKIATLDYAPVALQIADAKPDAVIIMLSEGGMIGLAKELRKQGVKAPIYSWAGSQTQNLLDVGGEAFEGIKAISWTYPPDGDTPEAKEYRDTLKKYAPNEKPDYISFYAYGSTKIFFDAVSRIEGEITPESFHKALYTMDGYKTGIFPPVTFSEKRHQGAFSVVPLIAKGGKWTPAGEPIVNEKY